MLNRIFGGTTFQTLEKSMEASKLRESVISHNIANSDTPDFKRSYVEFEEYMLAALTQQEENDGFKMRRTRQRHLPYEQEDTLDLSGVRPVVKQDNSTTLRMDGNNVDIEHEMAELAKNQVHYSTLVEQLNSEFRRLRTAIGGR